MSSRFSFEEVEERRPTSATDSVGAALAANLSWLAPFLILLDGLDFETLPSETNGATFFAAPARRDDAALRLISALDDVYAEVRDGFAVSDAHGELLECFVRHVLLERFPGRLGACQVLVNGQPAATYRLDAATGTSAPAIGVEAKTSAKALVGRGDRRKHHAAKAQWIVALMDESEETLAGIFVTWAPEDRFRSAIRRMIGDAETVAVVVAHEQLTQLPNRLAGLIQRLRPNA